MNEINWMQQSWECPKCEATVVIDYNFKVVPQSTTGETDMLPKHTETPVKQGNDII